ncbi:hypothetical protein [Streptosporangium sp. NPDC087985]|uniref:hypothetical protein n=1 Tax=Streptosporangium sp. NPDC087985 TaxID=3366196 RepID=UPI003802BFAD
MTAVEECLSPHVAMLQRDPVRLVWRAPCRSLLRVRPVAWTCFCRATVYELCIGGGRAFLRRTVQLRGTPQVHETALMSISQAQATWTAVLSGRAC